MDLLADALAYCAADYGISPAQVRVRDRVRARARARARARERARARARARLRIKRAGVTLGGGAVEQRLEHLDGLGLLLLRGSVRVGLGLGARPGPPP